MIADTLFRQETEKAGMGVADAEVADEVNKIMGSVGGREVFDQELAKANVTEDTVKKISVTEC